jgi:hypothetical protein
MRSPTPLWFLAGSLLLAAGLVVLSERDSGEVDNPALTTLRAEFHSYIRKTAPEMERLRAKVAQLQADLEKEVGLTERTQDLYDCSTAEVGRLNMERKKLKALLVHFEKWRDGMGGDPRLPGRVLAIAGTRVTISVGSAFGARTGLTYGVHGRDGPVGTIRIISVREDRSVGEYEPTEIESERGLRPQRGDVATPSLWN